METNLTFTQVGSSSSLANGHHHLCAEPIVLVKAQALAIRSLDAGVMICCRDWALKNPSVCVASSNLFSWH